MWRPAIFTTCLLVVSCTTTNVTGTADTEATALGAASLAPAATPITPTTGVPTAFTPPATPTLASDAWQSLPVVPAISRAAREIYQRGQGLGNNPRAFSKIGDGEISTTWFLSIYDLDPSQYDLGPHEAELEPVIGHFQGSFGRRSAAAQPGFKTTLILARGTGISPTCTNWESALECELREQRPGFAIISLGTNQIWTPEIFEQELDQIIDLLIEQGVVPVLSTKADNLEGDHRINQIIARLAYQHELPVWNFWLAVQDLPNHGLQPDQEHLTYAPSAFSDPQAMLNAWPRRNLTALRVLGAVWRGVTGEP